MTYLSNPMRKDEGETMTEEIDKHNLSYYSPHIYKCSCGIVAHFFMVDGWKIAEMPKKIKYLPCGHAVCAKTDQFDCVICAKKG